MVIRRAMALTSFVCSWHSNKLFRTSHALSSLAWKRPETCRSIVHPHYRRSFQTIPRNSPFCMVSPEPTHNISPPEENKRFLSMKTSKPNTPTAQEDLNQTAVVTNVHQSTESRGLPLVREEDLEEDFVRGSGAGGQKVNKTSNCVVRLGNSTRFTQCYVFIAIATNCCLASDKLISCSLYDASDAQTFAVWNYGQVPANTQPGAESKTGTRDIASKVG